MITKTKRRRVFWLILLFALVTAASSCCFELEPSASEESQRGALLLDEEIFDTGEESFQPGVIYEAEPEPIYCECFAEAEKIENAREPLFSGALSVARAENGDLRREAAILDELKEADLAAESAAIIMILDPEDHESEEEWDDGDDEYYYAETEESSEEVREESTGDSLEESFEDPTPEPQEETAEEEMMEESFEDPAPEPQEETIEEEMTEASFEESHDETSEEIDESSEECEEAAASFDYSVYSDLDLLAAICQIEAGYHYEGALAVANVVLNRLHSGFADSVYGVIFAPYQFATGDMEYYLTHGTSDTARQAAQDALNGVNNIGSFLHFNGRYWLDPATLDVPYVEIGGNVFY